MQQKFPQPTYQDIATVNASDYRTNSGNYNYWCDSTQTQFDSLVVLGEIEGGDFIDCEY